MKIFTTKNLLILIAFLLTANLATWYWFVAKLHLRFNAEIFDHIISPVSGILGVAGLLLALRSSLFQNKITQSQSLRPYFEKQIDKINERISNRKFTPKIQSPISREYTGFDFTEYMNDLILVCSKDKDFLEDFEQSQNRNLFTPDYIISRSYFDKISIIGDLTLIGNRFEYDNILLLIDEINESSLLPNEKIQLIRRIHRELMHSYMSQIRWLKHTSIQPPIPTLFVDLKDGPSVGYKFIQLIETRIGVHYPLFEKQFKGVLKDQN